MPDLFFENVETKARFKVVKFDEAAGTVTLLGRHNLPFVQPFTKEDFEAWGYRPVLVEAEAQAASTAPPAPPAAAPPPPPAAPVPPPPAP